VSPKSTAEKLLLRPGGTLWSSDAQQLGLIAPLPDGVRIGDGPRDADCVLLFAADAATLRELLAAHGDGLSVPAAAWVCYPKGNRADINRDTIWPILLEHRLRPISQVSLDQTWSALRFRALRPGEEFTGGKG
jgi:hypothetical protein